MERRGRSCDTGVWRMKSHRDSHRNSEKVENGKEGRQDGHHSQSHSHRSRHRRHPSLSGQQDNTITTAQVGSISNHDHGHNGRVDSLSQDLKKLSIKDVRTRSEQQERVPQCQIREVEDSTGSKVIMKTTISDSRGRRSVTYTSEKIIGTGSFGVVFKAICVETGETVAIKKVLQDRRFKNRELQIMRLLDHPNIVRLQNCFGSCSDDDETYLQLVLEYVPDTIYRIGKQYTKNGTRIPLLFVKLYVYQMCRSLAYIHKMGICHRDIKPQNLLVNTTTHQLKLCDFGSAKVLVKGEPNISYICSRYYRAPELIFGATEYATSIDVWSVGCVMAELLTGQPLFPGGSGIDQLVEIIKVMGTPTREEINAMNPSYNDFKFPKIKPRPLGRVLKKVPTDAVDLASKLLQYNPNRRMTPLQALGHHFFDELRDPATRLPDGQNLPPLFNWLPGELDRASPELKEKLRAPLLV